MILSYLHLTMSNWPLPAILLKKRISVNFKASVRYFLFFHQMIALQIL